MARGDPIQLNSILKHYAWPAGKEVRFLANDHLKALEQEMQPRMVAPRTNLEKSGPPGKKEKN